LLTSRTHYISHINELDKVRGQIIATVTVLYDKIEKNEELSKLQHEFSDMNAYLHSHLTETTCLEVMVVKGQPTLKDLVDGLKANKPVKQINFSVMTISENGFL